MARPHSDDLGEAEPKNVLAQPPQPARLELQPDDEQQQGDADVGDAEQLLGILDQPMNCGPISAPATM